MVLTTQWGGVCIHVGEMGQAFLYVLFVLLSFYIDEHLIKIIVKFHYNNIYNLTYECCKYLWLENNQLVFPSSS